MKHLFNTTLEVSTRVLLLLKMVESSISKERIVALDFIATYGREFNVSTINLHGDNEFKFAEYALRREMVSCSLKDLALRGYISFRCENDGLSYHISSPGIELCSSLNDEYADLYSAVAKRAIDVFNTYSDDQIVNRITRSSIEVFKGEQ